MSLQLPRLPQWAFFGTTVAELIEYLKGYFSNLQIFWQQHAEATEQHEATQDAILANLATTDTTITTAQAELAATQAAQAQTQADLALTQTELTAQQAALEATVDALAALDSTVTGIQNQGPYVLADFGAVWAAPTGTASRAVYAAYAGQTVSNPPTQAQVQAIDNAVKAMSEALVAVLTDLQANSSLTL